MQLILETETSLSIEGKMSALEQDSLEDRVLSNGDIKDIVKEVIGKSEHNGSGDKENVQRKDNIIVNTENNIDKEAVSKTAELQPEVENPDYSIKCQESEQGDVFARESVTTIEEKILHVTSDLDISESEALVETNNSQAEAQPENNISSGTDMEDSHNDISETYKETADEKKKNIEVTSNCKSTEVFVHFEHKDHSTLDKKDTVVLENDSETTMAGIIETDVESTYLNKILEPIKILEDLSNTEMEIINKDLCKETFIDNDTNTVIEIIEESQLDVNSEAETSVEVKDQPKLDANSENLETFTNANDCVSNSVESDLIITNQDTEFSQEKNIRIETDKTGTSEELSKVIEGPLMENTDIKSIKEGSKQNSTEDTQVLDNVLENNCKINTVTDDIENCDVEMITDVIETSEVKSADSTEINTVTVDPEISDVEMVSVVTETSKNTPADSSSNETTTLPSKTEDKSNCVTIIENINKVENENTTIDLKDDTSDVEEVLQTNSKSVEHMKQSPKKIESKVSSPLIRLSNTLDILSDDEDETPVPNTQTKEIKSTEKLCINLDDDDDIMLIDEDTDSKDAKKEAENVDIAVKKTEGEVKSKEDLELNNSKQSDVTEPTIVTHADKDSIKDSTENKKEILPKSDIKKDTEEDTSEKPAKPKPLVPNDFFNTYKKNFAEMTRDDLEEFCILKIVESIIDRSNLTEIRTKLKTMAQNIDEYKKKAMMLTKQNRDLQVVLKSVQEEQKKRTDTPIVPLRITRSVGMQVLMTDKNRRKPTGLTSVNSAANTNTTSVNPTSNNRPVRNTTNKVKPNVPQQIPVPRLVPAMNSTSNKTNTSSPVSNNAGKSSSVQNGVKTPSPVQKAAEKRTHNRMQSQSQSVTVDLTDDEPPTKVPTKSSSSPPVRLVNQQNLLAPRQPFGQAVNSPRKVYIPISGPQGQNIRPGQTIMLKAVAAQSPRPRGPTPPMVRVPQNSMPMRRVQSSRHPAPLPDSQKQYQPPNWKALPPAPDLKLSKVENGIVISWKIDGYQEENYEEIASYQLYAYQETSAPPNTTLWKKIGDVKALPLPMACTLTQFMAGYKYYFAVRAVDVRSRFGPFSLPGSILLLNKM